MVKVIYSINRKPDMSVEEFQRYWRETHAPIAARGPGVRTDLPRRRRVRLWQKVCPALSTTLEDLES